jgi:hypothetical protein
MTALFTETTDQIALEAAFQLHGEMLRDEGFAGYDGSIDAFNRLAEECLYIVDNELSVEQGMYDAVANTVEWFYAIQAEISEGERDACYWMGAA